MKLTLKTTIVASLVAMAALSLVQGGISWRGQSALVAALDRANNDSIASLVAVQTMQEAGLGARLVLAENLLVTDKASLQSHEKELADNMAGLEAAIASYGGLVSSDEDAANLKVVATSWATWKKAIGEIKGLIDSGRNAEALEAYWGAQDAAGDATAEAISKLADFNVNNANLQRTEAEAANSFNLALLIGAVALFLGTAAGVLLLILRRVLRPLAQITDRMTGVAAGQFDADVPGLARRDEVGEMAKAVEVFRENGIRVRDMTENERREQMVRQARLQVMQSLQEGVGAVVGAAVAGDFTQRVDASFDDKDLAQVADGINSLLATVDSGLTETGRVLLSLAQTDLTERMEGEYSGAFARLRDNVNAVADNLSSVVTQLRSTSSGVKLATSEILSGANDLSERTTKQAATIEETSAAVEQLSVTVASNARNAGDASEKAVVASRAAAEGGEVMREATTAMERISTSSAKISNIIGLIDDIAFQTNLLALNASVEAARAGEAGKGFAVVAVEVRRLAQSAANASSEVKALIQQSSDEVRSGSALVDQAASKLTTMLGLVSDSAKSMESIARASTEQANAIAEINTAVRQMDEMTQHNAALVEETNAAIEQTETQANELDRIVATFRVATTATAAPPAPLKRPVARQVAATAKRYISKGNAAVAQDWTEF